MGTQLKFSVINYVFNLEITENLETNFWGVSETMKINTVPKRESTNVRKQGLSLEVLELIARG